MRKTGKRARTAESFFGRSCSLECTPSFFSLLLHLFQRPRICPVQPLRTMDYSIITYSRPIRQIRCNGMSFIHTFRTAFSPSICLGSICQTGRKPFDFGTIESAIVPASSGTSSATIITPDIFTTVICMGGQ